MTKTKATRAASSSAPACSECLPLDSDNIPLYSVLTMGGWLPPDKQPAAMIAGRIIGERVSADVIATTMAVIGRPNAGMNLSGGEPE